MAAEGWLMSCVNGSQRICQFTVGDHWRVVGATQGPLLVRCGRRQRPTSHAVNCSKERGAIQT